jgi:KUP system potassium uptake protein
MHTMTLEAPRTPPPSALLVGALGVVFGDIGTSPLYTLRECFTAVNVPLTPANILGILSCIAWSLFLIITIKYVMIIMKSDNNGEGGILAMTALAIDQFPSVDKRFKILMLGLLGAALFYGDTLITPAISVLSAVEGISVHEAALEPFIVPISLVILAALFAVQKQGTGTVSNLFGPIMVLWFGVLAILGTSQIVQNPTILNAFNPIYAMQFFENAPMMAFLTMGAVVLAVTGGEALYADMGHFGRKPIQRAWLYIVFPALLLNYFGQGALLMRDSSALENPFYHMVPNELMLPLVGLATLATIIASQAVISGAFSLTQQAIQLGYLPRMRILHTSAHNMGHIYLPALNALMLFGVMALVIGFQKSSNLAAAYGMAVCGTMLLTTFLATIVMAHTNRLHLWAAGTFAGVFTLIDSILLTSNLHKIPHGGWFPLLFGALIFIMMHTWIKGREAISRIILRHTPPLDQFIAQLDPNTPRVPRTAVFLTSDIEHAPPALVYNLRHNAVLHEQTLIIKICRARVPMVAESNRINFEEHDHGITSITATYGFMERPNIQRLLTYLHSIGITLKYPEALSYFLTTHTYIPSKANKTLSGFEEPMFIMMDNMAQSAVDFFNLPRPQVIELGNQIEI